MRKRIPIHSTKHEGLFAIIDEEDYDIVSNYRWNIDSNGYALARVYKPKDTTIKMHRIVAGAKVGDLVDHKNGVRLDNRRKNLRLTNHAGNQHNRKKNRKSSGDYKGVSKHCAGWRARINVDRKEIYLGTFKTQIEAALAYNKAARKYHGEFARLNIIPKGLQ